MPKITFGFPIGEGALRNGHHDVWLIDFRWYSLPNTLPSPTAATNYHNDDLFNSEHFDNIPADESGHLEDHFLKDNNVSEHRRKENKFSNDDEVSKYQGYVSSSETMGNMLFDWTGFFQKSLTVADRGSPPPIPHPIGASIAALSADEFGLDFELDTNMSEDASKIGFADDQAPMAAISKSIRIQDIVRPESVASSWYVPSEHSELGTPSSKNGDFKQSLGFLKVQTPSQASAVPIESCHLPENKETKAAVTANAFEVVAAVDHVEHVSAPTESETYFQSGELFQTIDKTDFEWGKTCPYKSLCCYFHKAAGRPVTNQRPPPRSSRVLCSHSTGVLLPAGIEGLGDCIIRLDRPLGKAAISCKEIKQSTEDAFSTMEDILWTTASQETKLVHDISMREEILRAKPGGLCEHAAFVEDTFLDLDDAVDSFPGEFHQEANLAQSRAIRKPKASATEALYRFNNMFRKARVAKDELAWPSVNCDGSLVAGREPPTETPESELSDIEQSVQELSTPEILSAVASENSSAVNTACWTADEPNRTIFRPAAELSKSHATTEGRLSTRDAFTIFETILHQATVQNTELTLLHTIHETQKFIEEFPLLEGSTRAAAQNDKTSPSHEPFDYETTLADENTFWTTAAHDGKLIRTGILQRRKVAADAALPSFGESSRIITVPRAESTPTTSVYQSRSSAEYAFSMLDECLRITAAIDAEVNIAKALKLTKQFRDRRSEVRNLSNISFLPGFKFSVYGDILEDEPANPDDRNEPEDENVSETGSLTSEENKFKRKPPFANTVYANTRNSSKENEKNLHKVTMSFMKDLNLRVVGKAASPKKKKVRALIDIFQSHNLIPQSPPILHCNSRIGTPPQQCLGRSNGQEAEQDNKLNRGEFMHDWSKVRPTSAASNADTDISSRFGEELVRYGDVAHEDKENIAIA